ncbi:hypothetical protein [Siphonobacter sp. SORGH_AS_1065]|uniref:hypothetical protein n=1 Tax=Siphonobacter sp. SORGH_AS_1065 TaxID=3041795 RepID=UPI002782B17C|nr:hypothetical protein [Siphonobacter sp. SORGH_AS_1065]MDQ1087067.1 hypothetical protein [Siphonobacter sp. SORGH_AS_1065]
MKRILALGSLLLVLISCEKEKVIVGDSERLRFMEQEILALIQDKACQGRAGMWEHCLWKQALRRPLEIPDLFTYADRRRSAQGKSRGLQSAGSRSK